MKFIDISPIEGVLEPPETWGRRSVSINVAWISMIFPLHEHKGIKVARLDVGKNSLWIDAHDHRRIMDILSGHD
jgi:hypothetical protein